MVLEPGSSHVLPLKRMWLCLVGRINPQYHKGLQTDAQT